MTMIDSIEKLKEAAKADIDAVRLRLERYDALTRKIVDYQLAEGDAPSVEDFIAWRDDVEIARAIKTLGILNLTTNEQP